jgi:hypothetical protein
VPFSVRLDEETEALLNKTARALDTTKSEILKSSIQDYCRKTLKRKKKRPYDLIIDPIGQESSGKGDLAINSERILRKAFNRKNDSA